MKMGIRNIIILVVILLALAATYSATFILDETQQLSGMGW